MKLKSNLKFTQHGIDQVIDGKIVVADNFVEFDGIRIKKDGEFLEIALLSDGEVACLVDEVMVLKDGWSVELKDTVSFKIGVKVG